MKGFSNWKDGTIGMKKHECSDCHSEAVEAVITLPSVTHNVAETLSQAFVSQKEKNRAALLSIMHAVRYLARQGLLLRGDRYESDSNFTQLLKFMAQFDQVLEEWLKRKDNVYTSAVI